MAKRGRPKKVFSLDDLRNLYQFLEVHPYLTCLQAKVLDDLKQENFNDEIYKRIKIVERYRVLYLERQTLLEQIKVKEKNQQKLLDNEIEILQLASSEMDIDIFFKLERALESYQKIHKAVLNDRIRLEKERRRDVLNKSRKTLTEAQIKRNEENRRKYEVGAAVLAAFKELNIEISKYTSEQIKRKIKADINFKRKVRSTKIFKEVAQHQEAYYKRENLFVDVLQSLAIWKKDNKQISTIEIERWKSKYE